MKTFNLFGLIAALGLILLVVNVWAAEPMGLGWSNIVSLKSRECR